MLLNIAALFQMRQIYALSQTYNKMAANDDTDSESDNEPADLNGYSGDILCRKNLKLTPIAMEEIEKVLKSDENKLADIMRMIRLID